MPKISSAPAGTTIPSITNGRLTLTTNVPVTINDVTGATTIYFTPYNGNLIALYNGTNWYYKTFTQISLALDTLTSGANYDVFVYDNAGTLTLEFSAAWTNDTTRNNALTTQNGIQVKSGALTRKYLGTFRTTSTTATADAARTRFLWNNYNRVIKGLEVKEDTDSWTYTTATWRQVNASTNNAVEVVDGLGEGMVEVNAHSTSQNAGAIIRQSGIGVNSTTAFSGVAGFAVAATTIEMNAFYAGIARLGYSYFAWLERSTASGTTTWYGDNADNTLYQTGFIGQFLC